MSKAKKGKGRPSRWTDELIEQMVRMWQQGVSASDIAKALGQGLSRNAVIGKIHRLRKEGKVPASRDGDVKPKRARACQPQAAPQASGTASAPAAPATTRGQQALAAKVEAAPESAPAPQAETQLKVVAMEEGLVKDIMDLKHHSCRWPIGTPGEEGFSYCGRKAAEGGPYCEHHAAIAYTSHTGQKRATG